MGRPASFLPCLAVDVILGAIFALTVDSSARLCFSRANADLRYTQSEAPSTLQPQSLFDSGLVFTVSLGAVLSRGNLAVCINL